MLFVTRCLRRRARLSLRWPRFLYGTVVSWMHGMHGPSRTRVRVAALASELYTWPGTAVVLRRQTSSCAALVTVAERGNCSRGIKRTRCCVLVRSRAPTNIPWYRLGTKKNRQRFAADNQTRLSDIRTQIRGPQKRHYDLHPLTQYLDKPDFSVAADSPYCSPVHTCHTVTCAADKPPLTVHCIT